MRMPFFVAAVSYAALFLYAAPRLTTEKLETARDAGLAAKTAADAGGADASTAIAESGISGAPPPIDEDEI